MGLFLVSFRIAFRCISGESTKMVKDSACIGVPYQSYNLQIYDCCSLYPINDCIIPQESRISPLEEDPQAAPEVGGDLGSLFFFSFFCFRNGGKWGEV